MRFCNGVTCSVNTGGMTGKLTFGKGTQVSVTSGESSQLAPFATPWASATNPSPWDVGDDHGEASCGCYNCLIEASVKGEGMIINL